MLLSILTKYRGIIIFLFAVPVSFIFNTIQKARNWIYNQFFNTAHLHDQKVKEIREEISKAFIAGKKMCTARSPWKSMSVRTATFKKKYANINVNLKNILSIDTENMLLKVEPLATMYDVSLYLNKRGYTLAVLPEMDDLTVGGLLMGLGIETTSHKEGFLFETVSKYELIMPSGELKIVTRDNEPELFYSLPMSRGTLGFLTAVELKIVKASKYVHLEYIPFYNLNDFSVEVNSLCSMPNPPRFIEGLVFSDKTAVILKGDFSDKKEKGIKINAINRWYKPWFHLHAKSFLDKGKTAEYIPIQHYHHRHTPSVFFQLKDLIPFSSNRIYRWLFGWLGAPKISLMKFSLTKELRKEAMVNRVAQDIIIPLKKMQESLDLITEEYEIYPLWICPVKMINHGNYEGLIRNPIHTSQKNDSEIYVDVGIYGIPPAVENGSWDYLSKGRNLEKFVREVGGFQMLYGDMFMTRNEFEQMFSFSLYNKMRMKYQTLGVLPDIYEKVSPEEWLIDLNQLNVNSIRVKSIN